MPPPTNRSFEFKRGDVDGDGTTLPLIDAIYPLDYGFVAGAAPPCLDAADVDGNGVAFPLIDAIYLLEYGFKNGPPPPSPGPNQCGPDASGDNMECSAVGGGCS